MLKSKQRFKTEKENVYTEKNNEIVLSAKSDKRML